MCKGQQISGIPSTHVVTDAEDEGEQQLPQMSPTTTTNELLVLLIEQTERHQEQTINMLKIMCSAFVKLVQQQNLSNTKLDKITKGLNVDPNDNIARDGEFGTKCSLITYDEDENDEAFLNEVANRFEEELTEIPDDIEIDENDEVFLNKLLNSFEKQLAKIADDIDEDENDEAFLNEAPNLFEEELTEIPDDIEIDENDEVFLNKLLNSFEKQLAKISDDTDLDE
ncbi:unnamed protein product [Adineta steineri]|uniref:Uncharacterized protein n=1 Tax=Adineta steineri TaxID=433720 RepID=A0A818THQ0_9BILA|nr:unnamed protein product [Adineta steineri]CAF3683517.1 unnamed protein product [Adineta steineri]